MSSLLERSSAQIRAELGTRWPQGVVRVEPGRKEGLTWTLEGPRWLRTIDGRTEELLPHEDEELALARRLPELEVQGRARVLSWRPGRRIVVALDDEDRRLVLKGFRRGRSAAAAAAHRAVEASCAGGPGFDVPRLAAVDPEHDTLVFERLDARPLRMRAEERDAFFEVVQSLRALQDAPAARAQEEHPLGRHAGPEELGALERMLALVAPVAGEPTEEWRTLYERIVPRLAALDAPEPVLVHRDLHEGQLGWSERGPALFDFDLAALGDSALDVANLTAHLALLALQGRRRVSSSASEALGEALLAGLGRRDESGFMERVRIYQSATFLRLSLVHSLRPRTAALAPLLLTPARWCLEHAGA